MLAAIPLKFWLSLGAVLIIGLIIAHDHHLSKLYKAEKAATAQLEATLAAERQREAQIQADHKLAQETSSALQERLSAIERERSIPLPRLRCVAARLPTTTPESGTSAGSDGSTGGREPEEVEFDPTPGLSDYGHDCEIAAARLEALQGWETARSH